MLLSNETQDTVLRLFMALMTIVSWLCFDLIIVHICIVLQNIAKKDAHHTNTVNFKYNATILFQENQISLNVSACTALASYTHGQKT